MKKILVLIMILLCGSPILRAKDLKFVQITDVRYSAVDTNESLSKIVNEVNTFADVDFVVFTGDNIAKVSKNDLEAFLKEAKKLKKPFYVLLGDKDVNKYKDLSKKQYAQLLKRRLKNYKNTDTNYIFENNGVVFFVVDGSKDVIPSSNGYFKENVLEWVDANLDLYPKKNVVILQHFPLVPPTDNENYVTLKPEKYLSILHNHPNVKAVISGHFGVNKEQTVDGITHITTAPAPYYRIIDILDCTSSNPTIWAEIRQAQ